MATVNFFIRIEKKGILSNIYVRLKEGRTVDFSTKTGMYINPENWNSKLGMIRPRADIKNKDEIKSNLSSLKRFIEDEFLKVNEKSNPGKDWLKTCVDRYLNPEKYIKRRIDLFEFIETFIKSSEARINPVSGKKISLSTLKKYGTCYFHLRQFSEKHKTKIDFDDITVKFYYDFTRYLSEECNLATNTIGKQIAILKGFLNFATEQGLNKSMDFRRRSFKIVTEDSEAIYLNEEDLDKIWKTDFCENNRLEKIRDIFLIGCWTGCRFSDLPSVNFKNIKNQFLFLEQEKTGNKVTIPIHSIVRKILDKYNGEPPVMPSNQKFNEYIKEVCRIAEISKSESRSITRGGKRITETFPKWQLVSSHTARRSFATNLYKSGFPSISIMSITGHRTEKAFLKYIKVTPEEHAILLQNHWEKLVN